MREINSTLYRNIEQAYGNMSTFDAVGLVGCLIKEKMEAALKSDSDRKKLELEIASLLKLINAACKMIDEEKLTPEQRIMLGGTFSTGLKDVKHFLLSKMRQDGI